MALKGIGERIPIALAINPSNKKQFALFVMRQKVFSHGINHGSGLWFLCLHRLDPLGYFYFSSLMNSKGFTLTDSGGIEEETTAFRVPCLTLRDAAQRPISFSEVENALVWYNAKNIAKKAFRNLDAKVKKAKIPWRNCGEFHTQAAERAF